MTRGPVPKRDAERRRVNKKVVPTTTVNVTQLANQEVEIPEADPKWHPTARLFWDGLVKSGQNVFYEPSDWAIGYITAENLSRWLKPRPIGVNPLTGRTQMASVPINGAEMQALLKATAALMATEAERRRLSIELERQTVRAEQAKVMSIVERRQALMKGT